MAFIYSYIGVASGYKNKYSFIRSKKNRVLSFRHISYILLYLKLKKNLREGFLWF